MTIMVKIIFKICILLLLTFDLQAQTSQGFAEQGWVHYRKKEYDSCMYCYGQASLMNPGEASFIMNKAVCEIRSGQYKDGLADLRKVLLMDSTNDIACYDIACVYSLQKNASQALHYLDLALHYNARSLEQDMTTDDDLIFLRKQPGYLRLRKKYQIKE